MATGWEGKLVKLVPLDVDQHLDHAVKWMNDPDITQYLLVGDFPMTRLAEREWFEAHSKVGGNDIQFAIETVQGKHIGFSGVHRISWRDGTAVTGTLIGEKGEWGKGYGTDAAGVRTRYAFDVLGLRILYSSVLAGNDRSLRMLTKAGYRECGRMPKRHWKRGAYVDEIMLYLDRESWAQPQTP
ncbi:MAG TPA: GNAT family protein [Fimbriimonadaceae bacterium]|nr:GNAT family protein [Fimbriimonadaceae bacterium]